MVGISRLTEHAHWGSDIFVGGLIGFACGRQVVAHYNKVNKNNGSNITSKEKVKPELVLTEYGNQIGFILKW